MRNKRGCRGLGFGLMLILATTVQAATFDGNVRLEINDSSGGLSWDDVNKALTVSCWFKISVPSDKTISQNMTILADRRTGSEGNLFSYLLRYNYLESRDF